jgi:hypothetical protein
VATPNAQRIGGHQTLNVNFLDFAFAQATRLVGLKGTYQPSHAVDCFQTKVTGALRHFSPIGDMCTHDRFLQFGANRFWQHGHHTRVIAVQNHQTVGTKYFFFSSSVSVYVAVPVQMILGDVQNCGGTGLKRAGIVELETGQLQDPNFWQLCGHRQAQGV